MAHFWQANENPKLRAAMATDWLEDLSEFHEWIVSEACVEWRRTETRRPTPAEIRRLCLENTEPYIPPPKPMPSPPETAEQVAERIARRQAMGEHLGELAKMLRGEIPWGR